MSGAGAPDLEVDGSGLRVAVVAAQWHTEVMDGAGRRRAAGAGRVRRRGADARAGARVVRAAGRGGPARASRLRRGGRARAS